MAIPPPPTFTHAPESWFAWHPVRLNTGKLAWLRHVTRTEFVNSFSDYGYRYTAIKTAVKQPPQEN